MIFAHLKIKATYRTFACFRLYMLQAHVILPVFLCSLCSFSFNMNPEYQWSGFELKDLSRILLYFKLSLYNYIHSILRHS